MTPAGAMSGGVLYISYDGMLEPLGQSQVLAYLERLAAGRRICLISFEKPEHWARTDEREALARRIAGAGIVWRPLRYHKRPSALATAYDIAQGITAGLALVRRHRLSVVHARSYVPSVMALAIKRLTGARFLFDMRGLWADERIEGGIWPRGSPLYRVAKRFERKFLLGADAVISLTHAARREIEGFDYLSARRPPIHVIPTCADLDRFHPPARRPEGPFTLGYVGTVGVWYDFARVAELFAALRAVEPSARLLVLNRGEHDLIRARLAEAGVDEASFTVMAAGFDRVPDHIRTMHAGVLIARPAYSHAARAPTKLAEFLGCGVPCLVNAGVGDVDAVIGDNRVGVVVSGTSAEAWREALGELVALAKDPATATRCVETARREFSLETGVRGYDDIYRALGAEARR